MLVTPALWLDHWRVAFIKYKTPRLRPKPWQLSRTTRLGSPKWSLEITNQTTLTRWLASKRWMVALKATKVGTEKTLDQPVFGWRQSNTQDLPWVAQSEMLALTQWESVLFLVSLYFKPFASCMLLTTYFVTRFNRRDLWIHDWRRRQVYDPCLWWRLGVLVEWVSHWHDCALLASQRPQRRLQHCGQEVSGGLGRRGRIHWWHYLHHCLLQALWPSHWLLKDAARSISTPGKSGKHKGFLTKPKAQQQQRRHWLVAECLSWR